MNKKYLNRLFSVGNVDALISDAPQTRLWFSGVQTTDGYLVIEKNRAYLFVDGRYIDYAKENAENVEVVLLEPGVLKNFFDKKNYKKVVFEKDYLLYQQYEMLKKLVKPEKILWIKGQELRILKSKEEVQKIQDAVTISLRAYDQLMQWIQPGMTERQVAMHLNYLLKLNGAEKESFDEIVATGENTAEPHHHPTNKIIEEGELLKIDFGALFKGYSADITRTIVFGGNKKAKNKKILEILEIVKRAAKFGRDHVKPGIKASKIDKLCRQYITKAGYGKYFTHGTGHGLGIDVHELPYVSSRSDDYILEPGMVITVEPGIYIPGIGGARIEDDVLVTKNGRYVFSRKDEQK